MDRRIELALIFMDARCGHVLTVRTVAAECGLSVFYFEHLFRQETGSPFRQCLRDIRLAKAKMLLSDPRLRIKEVADRCGYAWTPNLTQEFKRAFGLSPLQYRRAVAQVVDRQMAPVGMSGSGTDLVTGWRRLNNSHLST